ncbi:amino acid permease [Dictyobacter arantiisoli]|uniref:Amino acid permease n=1 Tax=Dictyobacter arantiisoli TaxID=2014874 RepID=A0A5A5T9D0_9CHLR|nr:amino acid permease [Dictyobacter arantiisoli]GCF07865.1 amino acid permease [Dictyobacter arantiisoli]
MSNVIWRKKDILLLQSEAETSTQLKRTLGVWSLTAIGLGAIIGVGVFVLTGVAAATQAGPAIAISFIIAGLASSAAALCYSEFASMIPVAGSAYTYGYAVLGELLAWIIGWDLLIEYTLVVSVVAIGLSGYVNALLVSVGIHIPAMIVGAPGTGAGHGVDLFAILICLFTSWLLTRGMEESARFNSIVVLIKLLCVLITIVVGAFFIKPGNWHPFAPFGFPGIMGGAALVFFAVFGYDAMSTAAEEAKHPQRDLPLAILISLLIALVLYVLMSLVLTGIVSYKTLNNSAPVANAFLALHLPIVSIIVSVGAIAGISSVLFAFMLAAARIWFALSRDGLLPVWFAHTHPVHKTPYRPTWIIGIVTAVVAGFIPIAVVAELVNIGTLSAFVIVCASIIILRHTQPTIPRRFKTPFVPVIPIIGIIFSLWLIISLQPVTWIRFLIWLALGLVVYFLYGIKHSRLNIPAVPTAIEEDTNNPKS